MNAFAIILADGSEPRQPRRAAMNLARHLAAAQRDPAMIEAARAMGSGRLDVAERGLKACLRLEPGNVAAMRMLAEVAARLGRYRDGEALLARAMSIAPDFYAARANYVTMLHRQSKFVAAHVEADRLIAEDPADDGHRALKASVLVRTGGYTEAIALYREVLARHPGQPRLWINLGHVLKTVGDRPGSVAAYRAAIAGCATLGDAWWSLANLKTERLDADDIAAMEAALARATAPTDRYHLHFALGKALEDAREWEASFAHYAEGNRLRRAELPYDPERTTEHMRRSRELLTPGRLSRHVTRVATPRPNPSSSLACRARDRR